MAKMAAECCAPAVVQSECAGWRLTGSWDQNRSEIKGLATHESVPLGLPWKMYIESYTSF
jgi:hypothetical protein